MDLRPLLQQLSSRLAETLAGGSRSGPGSGGSGAEEAATLTAVRQACLDGGGPGVQASMQVTRCTFCTLSRCVVMQAVHASVARPFSGPAPLPNVWPTDQVCLPAPIYPCSATWWPS